MFTFISVKITECPFMIINNPNKICQQYSRVNYTVTHQQWIFLDSKTTSFSLSKRNFDIKWTFLFKWLPFSFAKSKITWLCHTGWPSFGLHCLICRHSIFYNLLNVKPQQLSCNSIVGPTSSIVFNAIAAFSFSRCEAFCAT